MLPLATHVVCIPQPVLAGPFSAIPVSSIEMQKNDCTSLPEPTVIAHAETLLSSSSPVECDVKRTGVSRLEDRELAMFSPYSCGFKIFLSLESGRLLRRHLELAHPFVTGSSHFWAVAKTGYHCPLPIPSTIP